MRHLYAGSPDKTTFSFVQHQTAKSIVFGFFRHEYPTVPDCRLMGVRINIKVTIGGKKLTLPYIRDFVAWVRTAGVWGYCQHIRNDKKEVHYWIGQRATAENTFEFILHEIAHGGGFRSERSAIKIAGLGSFALEVYKEYFEPLLSRSSSKAKDIECLGASALRPCPHCGATVYVGVKWLDNLKCCVTCRTCGACGPERDIEAEAKAVWSAKDLVVPILTQKLVNHIKLCRKNLKSDRVVCCASCPFESAVVSADISLAPLFDAKRRKISAVH